MQLKQMQEHEELQAAEHIMENLSLVRTADNQKDFLAFIMVPIPGGIPTSGNIINGSKETLIGRDGALPRSTQWVVLANSSVRPSY